MTARWPQHLAALAVLVAAVPLARAQPEEPIGEVVFAKGSSLWRTDSKGKGPPVEVVALPGPAADVRAVRSDPSGRYLIVDHAGRWYWSDLSAKVPALALIPCQAAVRIAADGTGVTCATSAGKLARWRFGGDKPSEHEMMGEGAVVRAGAQRGLVWADAHGIWRKSLGQDGATTQLAPQPPLRNFLAAPDGKRAVGVFLDEAPASSAHATAEARPQLYSFALDGVAARRKTIREGVPIDWSWDSQWVSVQDGNRGCVMRSVGGQYKCWKGYQVVSLSPDGSMILLLGPRRGEDHREPPPKKKSKPKNEDAEGEDEPESEAPPAVTVVKGPLSLYRARIGGAQTDSPALIERIVDGAALWLPARTKR